MTLRERLHEAALKKVLGMRDTLGNLTRDAVRLSTIRSVDTHKVEEHLRSKIEKTRKNLRIAEIELEEQRILTDLSRGDVFLCRKLPDVLVDQRAVGRTMDVYLPVDLSLQLS